MSEPKRVLRSATVRGPPLEIDSFQDTVYYCFNFKANPSTTGLRHRGYVKFFKPKNARQKPLQHLECLVDCTCPDYRYRWAWTNKQRGSGRVGPQSMNQAWNKAPRHTNPAGRSGLCKHILAARQYIYGLLSSFPSTEPDTADKLNQLTKYATKRWTDFPGQMKAAKEREAELRKARALRNVVGRPPEPPAPEEPELELPEPPLEPPAPAAPAPPRRGAPMRRSQRPPAPLKPKPAAKPGAPKKAAAKPPAPYGGYGSQAEYDFYRRQGLGDSQAPGAERNAVTERVVNSNNGNMIMTDLTEARKLVHEMEDDILNSAEGAGGGAPPGAAPEMDAGAMDMEEPLEPSEPPVSDSAIGADSEGETALGLLRQMTELLTQLVTAVAPPEEMPGEEGMEGMEGGEGGPPSDEAGEMPPEPPGDEEVPSESADKDKDRKKDEDEYEPVAETSANRRPSA